MELLTNLCGIAEEMVGADIACCDGSLEDDGSCNFAIGLRNKKVASRKKKTADSGAARS